MYVSGPLPLRLSLRSKDFLFGSSHMASVTGLLAGTSVECKQLAQSLQLSAALESELHDAVTTLRNQFPDLTIGTIIVTYLEESPKCKEPFTRVRARTPADCCGDVIGDLNRRYGLIESMDPSSEVVLVTAAAPSVELIGYDADLRRMTRGRGVVEYEFLGYDTMWPRPEPPDPKNPAVAKRA
jgi:translation elongation factor EF-G